MLKKKLSPGEHLRLALALLGGPFQLSKFVLTVLTLRKTHSGRRETHFKKKELVLTLSSPVLTLSSPPSSPRCPRGGLQAHVTMHGREERGGAAQCLRRLLFPRMTAGGLYPVWMASGIHTLYAHPLRTAAQTATHRVGSASSPLGPGTGSDTGELLEDGAARRQERPDLHDLGPDTV